MKPTIAIIGAGAVGGYYGGRLAQHGFPVHFLFHGSYEAVRRNGLIVKSVDGDFTISPAELHAYSQADHMPKADLVIVTLKTTANHFYESLIDPLLKDQTLILTLQNGLGNEEELARLFGPARIMGGLAFVCINRMNDGSIHHLDHGHIKMGGFESCPPDRVREVAELFNQSRIRCTVLEDLRYGRWEKLVWNVPFNGLGATLDKTTDKLIATPQGQALVRTLMLEVIAAAAGNGIHLPPDLPDRKIDETKTMGAYRTSMQIDRQENRPLEVEAILHHSLRAAMAARVPAPCLQMLYEMATLP